MPVELKMRNESPGWILICWRMIRAKPGTFSRYIA